jgi:hypothetical protein
MLVHLLHRNQFGNADFALLRIRKQSNDRNRLAVFWWFHRSNRDSGWGTKTGTYSIWPSEFNTRDLSISLFQKMTRLLAVVSFFWFHQMSRTDHYVVPTMSKFRIGFRTLYRYHHISRSLEIRTWRLQWVVHVLSVFWRVRRGEACHLFNSDRRYLIYYSNPKRVWMPNAKTPS